RLAGTASARAAGSGTRSSRRRCRRRAPRGRARRGRGARVRSGCATCARPRSPGCRPGSANSTASWAAAWCPARSCSSAARPGSVGQVREVAGRVMEAAKRGGCAVLLVGHVTKDGALAGPRVLEHLVDCVLQFEGERERTYRTLRALKNRFGSTNEVGVFEMRSGGLAEVLDASARFVGEVTRAPGSVVLAAMEGTRPLLVEVQALVSP